MPSPRPLWDFDPAYTFKLAEVQAPSFQSTYFSPIFGSNHWNAEGHGNVQHFEARGQWGRRGSREEQARNTWSRRGKLLPEEKHSSSMPRSPPQSEQNSTNSPRSYEARPTAISDYRSRDLSKRLDTGTQSSAPTLPSVAALTGYGVSGSLPGVPGETGSPMSYRSLGMHTILNPPVENDVAKTAPRVSQSPGRSISTHGPYQTPIISPRVRKRRDDPSPGRTSQALDARQGRRMLTPKSPSLRSVSQGVRGSPSAGSRTSNPHSDSRVYMAEQGDISAGHIPPLPPISLGPGPHGQYAVVQPHHEQYITAPGSLTNSTASYSANNQGYVGSPSSSSNPADRETTSPFRPSLSDSAPRGLSHQHQMTGPDAQSRGPNRAYGAGQPAYQMQISTDQGPVAIPVEIDLQQASKSADEKRKRNAGASARFRQRRKEKEQAASAHINDLRVQLQTLTEQRDFYRSERNFFRDILGRIPGAQYPPRPPSPQTRSSTTMTTVSEPLLGVEYGARELTEPSPAQRRRTSDYQPSFATGHMAGSNYPPYQTSAPPGPGYALPPPSLPAPMQDSRGQLPNSFLPPHNPQQGPPPPAPLRPQQHDPFRRDMNPR